MNNPTSGVGRALAEGLRLSSDEAFEQEKAREASKAAYRRSYWQGYAKRVKRVFGTVSMEEFEAAKGRAEASGRTVWGQIWAESLAYREQRQLLSPEVEKNQQQLISELRHIGNNLNQLAKQGHVANRRHGGLGNASLDEAAAAQMEELERLIVKFTVRLRPPTSHNED